ncbi:hypothetical protein B0J11DRAFT_619907 [Dendryphion nanum]|uniref:Uncharacterized protein n=1 Tax=Dendryphion nanum TaxID=256645 RepID=A0A9P9I9D0_9PLEO|nr:hypothetical protein B0J11DRAFT_619907 [Dendryphion nanum]
MAVKKQIVGMIFSRVFIQNFTLPEQGGGSAKLDEVVQLIASLKETIAQQSSIITNQNSIIESIRTVLTAIKAKQQDLKGQNAELQETMESLRAQLDTLSIEPPSTQKWTTVAASSQPVPSQSRQHASMVIKVATKEDAEKLLSSDSITFGGGGAFRSPFEEWGTPVA